MNKNAKRMLHKLLIFKSQYIGKNLYELTYEFIMKMWYLSRKATKTENVATIYCCALNQKSKKIYVYTSDMLLMH